MSCGPDVRPGLGRWADLLLATTLLLATSPALLLAAVAVAVSSPGPVLFRQQRVGLGGQPFLLVKLRTMTSDGDGPQVTSSTDPRITRTGAILRRTRLDELPGLWNVLRGDLALVGPRPEVPRFVELDHSDWQTILSVRPGLTDPVTLEHLDEEAMLAAAGGDPEETYRSEILPKKRAAAIRYLTTRSPARDLAVIVRTGGRLLARLLGAN